MNMEYFNEAMVTSITYHLFMFTDALPSATAQYLIGWSLVVNLSMMLSVNSFYVVKGMLNNCRLLILKRVNVFKAKKRKQKLLELLKEQTEAKQQAKEAK